MNLHLRKWMASASAERRAEVAASAGTSVGHLWQLAGGHRRASAELAGRLQDASGGEITIIGLRPDLEAFAHQVLTNVGGKSKNNRQ